MRMGGVSVVALLLGVSVASGSVAAAPLGVSVNLCFGSASRSVFPYSGK